MLVRCALLRAKNGDLGDDSDHGTWEVVQVSVHDAVPRHDLNALQRAVVIAWQEQSGLGEDVWCMTDNVGVCVMNRPDPPQTPQKA